MNDRLMCCSRQFLVMYIRKIVGGCGVLVSDYCMDGIIEDIRRSGNAVGVLRVFAYDGQVEKLTTDLTT
jgi:hypothetical protein